MNLFLILINFVISNFSEEFRLISPKYGDKHYRKQLIWLEKENEFSSDIKTAQLEHETPRIKNRIVSIVGRPNVGKSSIFNRITKLVIYLNKQKFHYGSVVNDAPGTTRDRQYSIADWNGKYFRIIDTGGYDDDQLYSDEEGLTSMDYEIRDYLFKHNKKKRDLEILLCVNKAESYRRGDILAQEFWKLGLGQPYPVSALHGTGLAELLDKYCCFCWNFLGALRTLKRERSSMTHKLLFPLSEGTNQLNLRYYKLCRPNSGKSSMINKLIGENRCIVSPEEGTTQDSTKVFVTHGKLKALGGEKMTFIDTAGMKLLTKDRRSYLSQKSSLKSIRASDVCILVIDSSWGISKNDIRMAEEIKEENKAAIIVCNKWDLVDKTPTIFDNVIGYVREKLYWLDYADVLITSAKSGQKVQNIFEAIQRTYKQYCSNLPTNLVNNVLKDAMFNRKLPVTHGRRLNIYYATQVLFITQKLSNNSQFITIINLGPYQTARIYTFL
ncbi:GTP-binding protein, putative [Theileria annulata]|uniref:GTPase Der n=1 Tax=Theileria annulata TaxID=5874 RepID=Q4UBS9_THEAN|nr:GTP-binding protein, putative [Theileria annulata]CAI75722.1 GTP-binding protein, putative [Theileria annulata]|eukprot:XP_955198.1 GTP-binding protein, putative [Theileria annulata]